MTLLRNTRYLFDPGTRRTRRGDVTTSGGPQQYPVGSNDAAYQWSGVSEVVLIVRCSRLRDRWMRDSGGARSVPISSHPINSLATAVV